MSTCRSTSSSTTAPCWPPRSAEEAAPGGSAPRPQHQAIPQGQPAGGHHRRAKLTAEGGGQHHHRPHHACRRQDPAPTAPTSPTCRSSASPSATRSSPNAPRQPGRRIIVGGSNYGQGSSREHAALVPLYLGVKAVIAKSLRPYPRGQPHQRRHPAPDLCRPR